MDGPLLFKEHKSTTFHRYFDQHETIFAFFAVGIEIRLIFAL